MNRCLVEPSSVDFNISISGNLDNPNKNIPVISYGSLTGTLKNTGEALKFIPTNATGTFARGTSTFKLLEWHIHAPSEHRVNNKYYPAEVHCKVFFKKN
jgi:carbonic anhydrase